MDVGRLGVAENGEAHNRKAEEQDAMSLQRVRMVYNERLFVWQ